MDAYLCEGCVHAELAEVGVLLQATYRGHRLEVHLADAARASEGPVLEPVRPSSAHHLRIQYTLDLPTLR